ncbi:MAG: methyltransferase domain-containing protein [Salaquimonas sp.]
MTPSQAIEKVKVAFPFKNYISGDLASYQTVGEVIAKYTKPGDKLFDLGSGPCDKTAIAQVMGCECHAVDDLNDDWHLRGDNVQKIQHFAKKIGIDFSRNFSPPKADSFDMVMLNDVMEHIHDSPRELMNALVHGLKPGGLVFISVPNLANIRKRIDLLRGRTNLPRFNLYYWYRGPWRGPQREYVRGDLVSLCENLGIEVVELYTVHHMLQNLSPKLRPIYKAVTALFPDWRDTWVLIAKKPDRWIPKLELSDAEFAKIYGTVNKESLYE